MKRTCAPLCVALGVLVPSVAAAAPNNGIAVLDIQGTGVDEALLPTLTEILTVEVDQLGRYKVIAGRDIQAMLGFEEQKDLIGCTDAACLAEIGGALGVDRILASHIGKVGSTFVVNIKLINIRLADTEGRVYETVRGEQDELIDTIQTSVKNLLGAGSRAAETIGSGGARGTQRSASASSSSSSHSAGTSAPPASSQHTTAHQPTSGVTATETSSGGLPVAVPIAVIGAGVVSVVVGAVFGAQALELQNQTQQVGGQLKAQEGQQAAMLANVFIITGGVVAAAGGALFLFVGGDDSDAASAALTPAVGPNSVGLSFSGRF